MVQRSVTEAMMSQGVSVPESGQRTTRARREGRGSSESQRQQQSISQNKVKIQPPDKHLRQRADSFQGLRSPIPATVINEKSRTSRSKVELPSRAYVRNGGASHLSPNPQGKVAQEVVKSKPYMRDTSLGSQKKRTLRQSRSSAAPVLYALRLLILGVGIGAIAGTLLSVLNPASRMTAGTSQTPTVENPLLSQATTALVQHSSGLKLSQEIMPLKATVQQLAAKNAGLTPGVFFVDLDTGGYLDLNGASTFASASMIKFPVLVAFFQDVDAGKIRLDEMLTLEQKLIGGGSGEMQYKPLGTKFTTLETATKMITISDNTATNMLIDRLGGAAALNQRFASWGLTATQIHSLLPDLSGTNTTTPRDLGTLMALVNQGDLISLKSRDRILNIMGRTMTNTLLPRGLGEGATIAHKTGDIGTLVGDVGLVDMPSGKRYIAVMMVKRPNNDGRAQELIRQVSHAVYQQFSQPAASVSKPPTPFIKATPVSGQQEKQR